MGKSSGTEFSEEFSVPFLFHTRPEKQHLSITAPLSPAFSAGKVFCETSRKIPRPAHDPPDVSGNNHEKSSFTKKFLFPGQNPRATLRNPDFP